MRFQKQEGINKLQINNADINYGFTDGIKIN